MSCDKEVDKDIKFLPSIDCGKALIPFNSEVYDTLATDPISVVDVRLEHTCLIVDFAYSGCAVREVGAMALLVHTPSESLLQVKIHNEDPLEACLAHFSHSDTFDLTSPDYDLHEGMTLKVYQWEDSFIFQSN